MKNLRVGVVTALFCVTVFAASRPAHAAFNLVWSDEFDAPLSGDKWNNYTGPYGSASNCYFMPSNAYTASGNLVLEVNTNPNNGGRQFTSGGVDTGWRWTQTYGRWEVRAKFADGYGVSGYIGLFAQDGSWPPEVDFAEVLGREYWSCHFTQHYDSDNKTDGFNIWNSDAGSNFNEWHTYALEWTPGTLKYFVDGKLWGTQPQRFTATPMKLALGTGTGDSGGWVGSPNDAGANGWPWPLGSGKAQMQVDYARIYSYVDDAASGDPSNLTAQ